MHSTLHNKGQFSRINITTISPTYFGQYTKICFYKATTGNCVPTKLARYIMSLFHRFIGYAKLSRIFFFFFFFFFGGGGGMLEIPDILWWWWWWLWWCVCGGLRYHVGPNIFRYIEDAGSEPKSCK